MAHSLSARKRVRQSEKLHRYNHSMKSRLATQLKKFHKVVEEGNPEAIARAVHDTHKMIDTVAGKGVIHRNTAARRKSLVSRRAKAAVVGSQG
jgi:small subunit ribosomal protein S20